MDNLFPRATPKEVQNNPWGYIMLLMAALLGAFVSWSINSQDKADIAKTKTLEKSVEDCRLDVAAVRKEKDMLQLRIDYFTDRLVKEDSVNREILSQPVKDLLKQINKK